MPTNNTLDRIPDGVLDALFQFADSFKAPESRPQALKIWLLIIEKNPACAAAYKKAYALAKKDKNFPVADAVCLAGMRAMPDAVEYYDMYAESAIAQSQWAEALQRWDELRKRFPMHRNAYNRAGWAAQEANQLDRSEEIVLEGIRKFPDFVDNYSLYADVAMLRKDWLEAMRRWRSLREKFPTWLWAYTKARKAAMAAGAYEEADAICLTGMEVMPNAVECYDGYAENAIEQSHWEEALKRWDVARQKFPMHRNAYNRAAWAAQCGKLLDISEKIAHEGMRNFPDFVDNYSLYADVAMLREDWREARVRWQIIRGKFPAWIKAYTHGAWAEMMCGDIQGAISICAQGAEISGKSNECLRLACDYCIRANDMQRAMRYAEKIKTRIDNHSDWICLARVHIRLQEYKQATHYCMEGIKNARQFFDNFFFLISKLIDEKAIDVDYLLSFMEVNNFFYVEYNITSALQYYCGLHIIRGDIESIQNLFTKHINRLGSSPDSASLYIALYLVNNACIDIMAIGDDKLALLFNCIVHQAKMPANKSKALLQRLAQEFMDAMPRARSEHFYMETKHVLPQIKPFYVDTYNRIDTTANPASITSKEKQKKNVALLFSGFVRDYQYAHRIVEAINTSTDYNVFTFYYMFHKLGKLANLHEFPSCFVSYGHGGLFKEIEKSANLNIEKFQYLFQPTVAKFVNRETDKYYQEHIGITHPQWLMNYHSYLLAEDYATENNFKYDYMARVRIDDFPRNINFIARACNDMETNNYDGLLLMDKEKYSLFQLCDHFAFGKPDAIKTYCEIGKDKNFLLPEQTDYWKTHIKEEYIAMGGTHEAHIGMWLKMHNIKWQNRFYLN